MKVLAVTNMYPSAAAPASGAFIEQQIQGLEEIGLQVRVVFIERRHEGAFSYYRMAPKISKEIDEFHPDLIHVMYGGVMADQITSMEGLPPVVVTFHGSDLLGENLSGLARKLISHYGVHCSRQAARRAAGVVLVARHLLKALIPRSRIQAPRSQLPTNVRIIPCGIDLERFKPMDQSLCQRQLGWASDFFNVLFATGANDPVKRPWLAHAAVEQLAAEGTRAKLHVLSGVQNKEVPIWINASDALLLTSLHEGSPTIVKEALACGLPVISVDVGDVAERIEDNEDCHLAKPDPTDLARKLRSVRKRGARLDYRSRLDELSHLSVAHKLKQFYEEILSRSNKPAVQRANKEAISCRHVH